MTTIPTGKFVWFDYVAKDQNKALAFYGELFGWKAQPIPGGTYTMLALGDQTIGGLMPTPAGAPPEAHWLSHLQVESAQATCDQVRALGGRVLKAPEKMGDFGTMAVVADPLGGPFALWQPAQPQGSGDFKGIAGAWCWNELYTTDTQRSISFYSQIGGFTEEKGSMPNSTSYHLLNAGGQPRAGVTAPPVPMPQQWMPYVQVDNVEQSIAKAKRLGATIHVEGEEVPGVGRFGILSDNQGAMLGLLCPTRR